MPSIDDVYSTYSCSRRYSRFEIVSFGIVEIAQRIFLIATQNLQASIAVTRTAESWFEMHFVHTLLL